MLPLQYTKGEHHQHQRQGPTVAGHISMGDITSHQHCSPSCEVGYYGFDVMADTHHWFAGGGSIIVRIKMGIGAHSLQCEGHGDRVSLSIVISSHKAFVVMHNSYEIIPCLAQLSSV